MVDCGGPRGGRGKLGTMNESHPIRILEFRSVRGTGGGPEKTILLGSARADASRYAVTVCYLRDGRDEIFHIDRRAQALPVDYLEVVERHSLDPTVWRPLRSLIRTRRIDIVHAHDYKTDLLALALAFVEPVIPMSTAHGWAGHSAKEQRFYYPADRWLLARFPAVVAVSSDIREALVRAGARPARVSVVPNGVDADVFRRDPDRERDARRALGFLDGDQVIGAVGRLESEKNYPLLMRVFGDLAREFPRLKLIVGGDGSQRPDLERLLAELRLDGRCFLPGHIKDVSVLHHALDLFVMCSDNEGSPNAVLEAMALGTPVVASDVGGIADLIRHQVDGLLVPRRDAAALATAIRRTFTDIAGARERARVARLRVERELSFECRMRKVEAIYDDLMARHRQIREGVRWWKAQDA
jgi:glycosyltransferase involved in cell wall biosynthesis